MALNNLGLGFVFTARNLASGTIGRLNRQVGTLGATSRRSGLAMRAGFGIAAASVIPLVAGLGLLGGAISLAQGAAEFQRNMAAVGNTAQASEGQLLLLRDAAIEAGIETQFSPDQATEALQVLASRGFDATRSIELLGTSLLFAAAGGISVEEAAIANSAAVRAFGLNAEEAATVADRLTASFQSSSLQAGEMSLAIGTVSRAAGPTNQSLNEMLIAMGLVRNTGVQASVAASSVSSALLGMARNAEQLSRNLQVRVTDEATGAFRPLLDIIADVDVRLSEDFPDAAERATKATELFGRFGLTAFSGISTQLNRMIQETPGIDTMSQAIDSLRQNLENSEGAAQRAADALLNTFAGQLTLLEGTIQTFGIVLGEPFANAFKPIVKTVVESLNVILRFFNDLPEPIKDLIAKVVVASGVFLTFAGILGIIVGLGIVVAPFFLAFIKILGLLLLALAPVIVATAAFAAAIAGMVFIVRQNIGGLGDFFEESFGRARLAFRALVEIFTSGTLSAEVFAELNAVENRGLRRFVFAIGAIGGRIRVFFQGIIAGFQGFATLLEPRIERMVEAFRAVGRALGFVDNSAQGLADTPMDDFADAGVRIGEILADVLGFIVDAITAVAQVVSGFVDTLTGTFEAFSPVFDALGNVFTTLGEEIAGLFRDLGIFTDEGGSGFETFGQVIGVVVGFIATALAVIPIVLGSLIGAFVVAARFLISAWAPVKTWFFAFGTGIARVFDTIVVTILNAIDRVIQFIGNIIDLIPEAFRPEALIGISETAAARRSERGGSLDFRNQARRRRVESREADDSAAAAATRAASERRDETASEVVTELARGREEARRDRLAAAERPIVVQIDGETVATASANADRRAGALGFSPVPAAVE